MSAKRKLVNRSDLPDHVVESIARLISPDILAFYESEEDALLLRRSMVSISYGTTLIVLFPQKQITAKTVISAGFEVKIPGNHRFLASWGDCCLL